MRDVLGNHVQAQKTSNDLRTMVRGKSRTKERICVCCEFRDAVDLVRKLARVYEK